MNLSISPINNTQTNKVSFGMAKFTNEGLKYAKACEDVYAPLSSPTKFQDPAFFEKKKPLQKTAFTKYYIAMSQGKKKNIGELTKTIEACGATENSYTNSMFIKQLLATSKQIEATDDKDKKTISDSIATVFKKNWNNPMLSKNETLELLELTKPSLSDKEYITITGVIEKSDAPTPKN